VEKITGFFSSESIRKYKFLLHEVIVTQSQQYRADRLGPQVIHLKIVREKVNSGGRQNQIPNEEDNKTTDLILNADFTGWKYPVPAEYKLRNAADDVSGEIGQKIPAVKSFKQQNGNEVISQRSEYRCHLHSKKTAHQ
jgi:hypothetical protein